MGEFNFYQYQFNPRKSEENLDKDMKKRQIKYRKKMLDKINGLFQSGGAGIEGRQEKIDTLKEIYKEVYGYTDEEIDQIL